MDNTPRHGLRLAAALSAAVLFLTGCGGGSGESADAPAAASDNVAPVPQATTGGGIGGAPDRSRESDESGGSGGSGASGESGGPGESVEITRQDQAIIYVAELTVRAKDVSAASDRAKQIVTGGGGHLARENSAAGGGESSALLVFRIPPASYPAVLGRLAKELGVRESLNQGTEDVTQAVADVESRVKSAQSALDSLRAVLKRANTIGEVLEVEREIGNRESELESLQARQRALAEQTAMATVTLRLIGPLAAPVEPEPEESPGFFDAMAAGWNALVATVRVVLVVVGALLPWLAVIVPLTLLVTVLVRRRRAKRPAVPAGAAGTPAWSPREWGPVTAAPPETERPAPSEAEKATPPPPPPG
ncbi:lipoprotein [Microtetraspora sp. NBRC 13810]|uniref:DUF4349 domain-containing protein n=1 Tax=Microtetraspora sp. NBRC 13810 TaxID=3030990 RepID=UPI0024A54D9E|nr:DUF4349 domain-containing protein [Microtetraspora sp. NBRC 13810]GLW07707.1 lipoprotein [Microtetraspora sp. NBRC 13810]